MDSTPRREHGATAVLTRRRLLMLLTAGLMPGGLLRARAPGVPARAALLYDFADPFAAGIVAGLRAAIGQAPGFTDLRLRDIDLALIDAAMTADAQRPANLVIGIGDPVARAVAARPALFANGRAWMVGVAGPPPDMGPRRIDQFLLRRDYRQYLQRVLRLLPDCRRIGVLHDRHINPELARLTRAADALGIRHECIEISAPTEIEEGVRHIASKADVLFGLDCEHIYNEMTLRGILTQAFAMQLPMIGLDASWVSAGALLGMDWNGERLGRIYARRALAAWRNDAPDLADDDHSNRDAADFYVNLQAAARFGVPGLPRQADQPVIRFD